MERAHPANEPSVASLIAIPALMSLAVTALRLAGELQHWSPRWFSSETGGVAPSGMSWLIGITWLALPFGAYFGFRLAAAGQGRYCHVGGDQPELGHSLRLRWDGSPVSNAAPAEVSVVGVFSAVGVLGCIHNRNGIACRSHHQRSLESFESSESSGSLESSESLEGSKSSETSGA